MKTISHSVVDLRRQPNGPRDRQLIAGQQVMVLNDADGWANVRAERDGYEGYVETQVLGDPILATHNVISLSTHAYQSDDFKSPDVMWLPFGSSVVVHEMGPKFAHTNWGYIPTQHLSPIQLMETDPADIALRFLGAPYLWGGNSPSGIDCSGLVQAACLACGIPCPGDSGPQVRTMGKPVSDDAEPARNMLYFWKGHVALALDTQNIVHANAHAMAVTVENIDAAIQRISAAGDGPVTRRAQL